MFLMLRGTVVQNSFPCEFPQKEWYLMSSLQNIAFKNCKATHNGNCFWVLSVSVLSKYFRFIGITDKHLMYLHRQVPYGIYSEGFNRVFNGHIDKGIAWNNTNANMTALLCDIQMPWFQCPLYRYNDLFPLQLEVHMPGDLTGLGDFDGGKQGGGRIENVTGRYIVSLMTKE